MKKGMLKMFFLVLFKKTNPIIRTPKGWQFICKICQQDSVFRAKSGYCALCSCAPGHIQEAKIVSPEGGVYHLKWAQDSENSTGQYYWLGDRLVNPSGHVFALEKD